MLPCTVLIGGADVLPALKARAATMPGEVLAFTDADALIALDVITKRRPETVALETQFAATPRGAALINRIKADPALERVEIRVVAHDGDAARVIAQAGAGAALADPSGAAAQKPPLDYRGTRRFPRFQLAGEVDVLVDGNVCVLIDLSTIGAQVMSRTVLKPNQRVRMALTDNLGNVRFNAAVVWASFEIPPQSGPHYRAGLAFVDADRAAVDAFRSRHQRSERVETSDFNTI